MPINTTDYIAIVSNIRTQQKTETAHLCKVVQFFAQWLYLTLKNILLPASRDSVYISHNKKETSQMTTQSKGATRAFPSVSEEEGREFLNGFFRRTESNIPDRCWWYFAKPGRYLLLPSLLALIIFSILCIAPHTSLISEEFIMRVRFGMDAYLIQNVIKFYVLVVSVVNLVCNEKEFNPYEHMKESMEVGASRFFTPIRNNNLLMCLYLWLVFLLLWSVLLKLIDLCHMAFKWISGHSYLRPVYLMDFATLKTDDCLKVPFNLFSKSLRDMKIYDEESLVFLEKILSRGCISGNCAFPHTIHCRPSRMDIEAARDESRYVFKYVVGDVFAMTGLSGSDIDILIVNCSLFSPTPSLSALIINMFGMREDIKSFNLGGMGCSAGLIATDLAKDLLQVHKNSRCLVVSTENISQNWYLGNDRSMLLGNSLFRLGGAAIILSNRPEDKYRSKYEFVQSVRIHKASNDDAYQCIFQQKDDQGKLGVKLSEKLLDVAGKAIERNLNIVIRNNLFKLPLSELVPIIWDQVFSVLTKKKPSYSPNFSMIFDYYCIHAGGRKVLDDIAEKMKLGEKVKPSRAALYGFGNTSSASPWYELEFIENTCKLKQGQTVFQIAFGSGFKCNSILWKCL